MRQHHLPDHTTMTTPPTRTRRVAAVGLAAGALVLGLAGASSASFGPPGTPGKDLSVGADNDNADNTFIQPPGVAAKQHMDNTDVLFGRGNDDLLIGRKGADTLLGGSGSDIMIGGPDQSVEPAGDVLVGDRGADIGIWSPGDGNDAFVSNEGRDTMILAPLVTRPNGSVLLTRYAGRRVPHVVIDDQPDYSCTLVKVPESEHLGIQFLVRFDINDVPVATVRLRDTERVLCPSPDAGHASVAHLTAVHPAFHDVRLRDITGTVGGILAPVA